MSNLLLSIYGIFTLIINKKYDVVFVYPNHFNRGIKGKNLLLEPFINTCIKNNLSFLLIEDTDLKGAFNQFPRNKNAYFLDFIILIKIIMKKLSLKDQRIYNVLKKYFFKGFESKLYITLAHNNVDIWRFINPNAIIADYQHGMIWYGDGKKIPYRKIPSFETKKYNVSSLVYGESYRNILLKYDKTGYHNDKNVISIGFYRSIKEYTLKKFKKNILWSMQNVDMETNQHYYNMIINILDQNKEYLLSNGYHIFIKNHPRYDRSNPLIIPESYSFVSFCQDAETIDTSVSKVELHITSKSTTAFDAGLNSIPTIFIDMLPNRSPRDIFLEQYNYPLIDLVIDSEKDLETILKKIETNLYYEKISIQAYTWAKSFYEDFNESKFLSLLDRDTV